MESNAKSKFTPKPPKLINEATDTEIDPPPESSATALNIRASQHQQQHHAHFDVAVKTDSLVDPTHQHEPKTGNVNAADTTADNDDDDETDAETEQEDDEEEEEASPLSASQTAKLVLRKSIAEMNNAIRQSSSSLRRSLYGDTEDLIASAVQEDDHRGTTNNGTSSATRHMMPTANTLQPPPTPPPPPPSPAVATPTTTTPPPPPPSADHTEQPKVIVISSKLADQVHQLESELNLARQHATNTAEELMTEYWRAERLKEALNHVRSHYDTQYEAPLSAMNAIMQQLDGGSGGKLQKLTTLRELPEAEVLICRRILRRREAVRNVRQQLDRLAALGPTALDEMQTESCPSLHSNKSDKAGANVAEDFSRAMASLSADDSAFVLAMLHGDKHHEGQPTDLDVSFDDEEDETEKRDTKTSVVPTQSVPTVAVGQAEHQMTAEERTERKKFLKALNEIIRTKAAERRAEVLENTKKQKLEEQEKRRKKQEEDAANKKKEIEKQLAEEKERRRAATAAAAVAAAAAAASATAAAVQPPDVIRKQQGQQTTAVAAPPTTPAPQPASPPQPQSIVMQNKEAHRITMLIDMTQSSHGQSTLEFDLRPVRERLRALYPPPPSSPAATAPQTASRQSEQSATPSAAQQQQTKPKRRSLKDRLSATGVGQALARTMNGGTEGARRRSASRNRRREPVHAIQPALTTTNMPALAKSKARGLYSIIIHYGPRLYEMFMRYNHLIGDMRRRFSALIGATNAQDVQFMYKHRLLTDFEPIVNVDSSISQPVQVFLHVLPNMCWSELPVPTQQRAAQMAQQELEAAAHKRLTKSEPVLPPNSYGGGAFPAKQTGMGLGGARIAHRHENTAHNVGDVAAAAAAAAAARNAAGAGVSSNEQSQHASRNTSRNPPPKQPPPTLSHAKNTPEYDDVGADGDDDEPATNHSPKPPTTIKVNDVKVAVDEHTGEHTTMVEKSASSPAAITTTKRQSSDNKKQVQR